MDGKHRHIWDIHDLQKHILHHFPILLALYQGVEMNGGIVHSVHTCHP